jgi:hypothetical protein
MKKQKMLKSVFFHSSRPTILLFSLSNDISNNLISILSSNPIEYFDKPHILRPHDIHAQFLFLTGDSGSPANKQVLDAVLQLEESLKNWHFPQNLEHGSPLILSSDSFRDLFEQDLIPFYDEFSRNLFTNAFNYSIYSESDMFTRPAGGNSYIFDITV